MKINKGAIIQRSCHGQCHASYCVTGRLGNGLNLSRCNLKGYAGRERIVSGDYARHWYLLTCVRSDLAQSNGSSSADQNAVVDG